MKIPNLFGNPKNITGAFVYHCLEESIRKEIIEILGISMAAEDKLTLLVLVFARGDLYFGRTTRTDERVNKHKRNNTVPYGYSSLTSDGCFGYLYTHITCTRILHSAYYSKISMLFAAACICIYPFLPVCCIDRAINFVWSIICTLPIEMTNAIETHRIVLNVKK